MSVNEKMTAIADAIREKTGGTELLGLNAMAQAIAALETGGGLPEGIAKIAYGTFKKTSSSKSHTIEYDLGVIPHFLFIFAPNPSVLVYSSDAMPILMYQGYNSPKNSIYKKMYTYKTGTSGYGAYTGDEYESSIKVDSWFVQSSYSSRVFYKNVEYMWVCGTLTDFA